MRTSPTKPMLVAAAVLFIGILHMTAHAAALAHPATPALPLLRLDYYATVPTWNLDPAQANVGEAELNALVRANLVRISPDDRPTPDLAIYTVSKDRLVYTFTIRSNARFANGDPVTAQDAAFSIERALSPSTQPPAPGGGTIAQPYLGLIQGAGAYSGGRAKTLAGVKVLNDRTLQIRITKPVAYFLVLLAYATADVLDRRLVKGHAATLQHNYLTNTCVANQGAGPFQFVCRDRGSNPHSFYSGATPKYTLVPNPYYYGHKPHIRIELPRYSGADPVRNAYKLYLAGRLDTAAIPAVYLSQWRGKSKEYHAYPTSAISFLVPNVHLAPFDNVHCRLAVAYAIDRETLAGTIEHGANRASYTVVPKGFLGFYEARDNPHYSPSRARAQLARCPGRTIPIGLKYAAGNLAAEAIGNMLTAAGMNVKLEPLARQDYLNVVSHPLDQTSTQIVPSGWVEDYPDPQDYCTLLLRSGQPYNTGGWSNASYDHLVDLAEFVLDSRKRAQLYIKAQHIALSQGAMISLTNGVGPRLIKPYVHGLTGPAAYFFYPLIPKNLDWSNVSISKH